MHVALIYVVFILALIIILGGCIVYFVKTICKKDDQVITGLMGDFSKYHFFPLLCVSALFIYNIRFSFIDIHLYYDRLKYK